MVAATHGRPPDRALPDDTRLVLELLRPLVICLSSIIGLLVGGSGKQIDHSPRPPAHRISLFEAIWLVGAQVPFEAAALISSNSAPILHKRYPPVLLSLYDAIFDQGGPAFDGTEASTAGGIASSPCTTPSSPTCTFSCFQSESENKLFEFGYSEANEDCDGHVTLARNDPSPPTALGTKRGRARHGRGKRSPEASKRLTIDLNDDAAVLQLMQSCGVTSGAPAEDTGGSSCMPIGQPSFGGLCTIMEASEDVPPEDGLSALDANSEGNICKVPLDRCGIFARAVACLGSDYDHEECTAYLLTFAKGLNPQEYEDMHLHYLQLAIENRDANLAAEAEFGESFDQDECREVSGDDSEPTSSTDLHWDVAEHAGAINFSSGEGTDDARLQPSQACVGAALLVSAPNLSATGQGLVESISPVAPPQGGTPCGTLGDTIPEHDNPLIGTNLISSVKASYKTIRFRGQFMISHCPGDHDLCIWKDPHGHKSTPFCDGRSVRAVLCAARSIALNFGGGAGAPQHGAYERLIPK